MEKSYQIAFLLVLSVFVVGSSCSNSFPNDASKDMNEQLIDEEYLAPKELGEFKQCQRATTKGLHTFEHQSQQQSQSQPQPHTNYAHISVSVLVDKLLLAINILFEEI